MNENLSYSFHIGNDKNKTTKAKQLAKDKPTNFNNNAIQNGIQLSKVNHHNLRVYEHNQELIYTIKGSDDIVQDTKDLYIELFDEARINYNNKQTRDDRKIDNYFNKIANDNKHDLAVEIIIELGDMAYWEDKSLEEKYKMVDVFKSQVKDLEKLVPTFKVANATIHFDEHSPHMHIVGVPFKDNCKTGMSKQVGKSDVFTVDSLKVIQDKMREYCIDKFNKVYNIDMELKEKRPGRNRDYRSDQMKNYEVLKNNYHKQQKKIKKVNDKTDILNEESNDIKKIINNLKQQPLNKNNVLLSNENKDKIIKYIEDIESNNKDVKSLTTYEVSLKDIKNDLINNHKRINKLEDKNEELQEELDEKDELLENARTKIKELEKKNFVLEDKLRQWKERFDKLVNYLRNKVSSLFGNKDKNIYNNIVEDLRNKDFLSTNDYNKIHMKPVIKKVEIEDEKKQDDDFDIGM